MTISEEFQIDFIGAYFTSLAEECPNEAYPLIRQVYLTDNLYIMKESRREMLNTYLKNAEKKVRANPIDHDTYIDFKITYYTTELLFSVEVYVWDVLYEKKHGFASAAEALAWAEQLVKDNMEK